MSEQEGMGLDEFLNHRSNEYSGGILKNWKKKQPPIIDTWLHTRSKIATLWQHRFPRVVEFKDRESGEKKVMVFGGEWTCWESSEVLQKQRHRDDETGRRIKPPVICPLCLFQEWVLEAIYSGELDWCKPIFRFEAPDSEKPTILRAGGLTGMFGKKTMTERELKQLKDARIDRSKAWAENTIAKLSYVFSVVDNDNPGAGCTIAIEPNLLGDKIKEVIQKAILDAEDGGNPFKRPYAIRWIHRPNESEFSKKYDAARVGKLKITPEIQQLIVDDDPPNLTKVLSRRNPIMLRAQMEDACLIPDMVPWDSIFGRACKAWEEMKGRGEDAEEESEEPKEKPQGRAKPAAKKPAAKKDDEEYVCEECGEMVASDAKRCPGCGAVNPRVGKSESQDFVGEEEDDIPY